MAEILTNNKHYSDIADTIRQMKNVNTTYKPREMASALKDIYSNEVEGVPPLSFEANGNNLLNYKIDGNAGGVGDRTINLLSSELVNGYHLNVTTGLPQSVANRCATTTPISINANNVILSFDGDTKLRAMYSTFLDDTLVERVAGVTSETTINTANTNKMYIAFYASDNSTVTTDDITNVMLSETSSNYEPYGYKIPVTIQGKNLLQNTASTNTVAGVTFTVNEDKSITCNGTATAVTTFAIKSNCNFIGKILTGCPSNGGANTYMLRERAGQNTSNDTGSGATLRYSNSQIEIRIASGYTCDNLTFKPMVRLASIENDTYEKFIEPITTNIYIDEPIGLNESISLSDTNTNIPTQDGTNTLSIDTTIQPSNVYVQAPKGEQVRDWSKIGYSKEPQIIADEFDYAKQIYDNWDSSQTNLTNKFLNDKNLVLMPLVDTSNVLNTDKTFSGCSKLMYIPQLDFSKSKHLSSTFYQCSLLKIIPQLDVSSCNTFTSMFNYCSSLITVPQLNTSSGVTFASMFNYCSSLITVGQLDASSCNTFTSMFNKCTALTTFNGLKNAGKAFLTSQSANYYAYTINLSECTLLTHDSLMNVINKLYDIATSGCNTQSLTLGSTNLAKLTAEEIAIATNKGWTVS